VEALALAARLSRREGDVTGAVAHLQQALAEAEAEQAAPLHLALAKLYEHQLGDPPRALEHARLATGAEAPEALRHRLARLERKQARAAQADSSCQLFFRLPVPPG
jgi:uncharacterized protein